MKPLPMTVLAGLLLTLTACGDTTKDRTLSGAGIGAGVGAVTGAMVGHPVGGAAIGAGVGAAAGAFTDKNDINLGKPVWR